MVMPRALVTPPTPARRPFGLLDYVDWQPVTQEGQRWLAGMEWMADCSSAATIALEVCGPAVTGTDGDNAFGDTDNRFMRGATAFTVYSQFTCSPIDFYDRANDLAEAALARDEGWQVENTFWTGVTVNESGQADTVYPHLAANTQVLDGTVVLQTAADVAVTGSGLDPRTGLGILESELGDCYGAVGLIHVPQKIIPHLHGRGLLVEVDGRWRTANGNWVVAGAGYPGTSPAGAAPGLEAAWMYATSPVFGYRSDARVVAPARESLNRATDTLTVRAYRNYVLGWSCCHAAVQVDAATS